MGRKTVRRGEGCTKTRGIEGGIWPPMTLAVSDDASMIAFFASRRTICEKHGNAHYDGINVDVSNDR